MKRDGGRYFGKNGESSESADWPGLGMGCGGEGEEVGREWREAERGR